DGANRQGTHLLQPDRSGRRFHPSSRVVARRVEGRRIQGGKDHPMIQKKYIDEIRVKPGKHVRLKDFDPGWAQSKELRELGKDAVKERAEEVLETNRAELAAAQDVLYAANTHAVLIVLQAMDAAGKDGTIKHVMSGVNPQGCQVFSFKKPSDEELDHNFLWRYMRS